MRISVIFVTNRHGAMKILDDDMKRQTFKDFELIISDDLCARRKEFDIIKKYKEHFKPRQKNPGDVWNLNKAYNDALDRASGELLVFLQDFIWIPANGLQRFWDMYELYPNDLVTGVGHKAKYGLAGISEPDERVFASDVVTPGNHTHWELNWASCPRAFMPRFDEEMDRHYGGENQYIAKKAQEAGHDIWIDRQNQCIGYSQEVCGGRPEDWEERHWNKTGRML